MSALTREQPSEPAVSAEPDGLAMLLLVRAACEGGATRADVVRDLAPLLAHKLSPAEWRRAAEQASVDLVDRGLAGEKRGRLSATDAGAQLAAHYLGQATLAGHDWPAMRDVMLVAKALGVEREPPARLKSLARPEALSAMIVQQAFRLPIKKNEQPARIRARLALLALERAFGNKIKAGMGPGTGLSAKAGRTLAGQLSRKPREFATDARLIAELAAEQIDAPRADLEQLRLALLKRLGTRALEQHRAATAGPRGPALAPPSALPQAANDAPPLRPDMTQFARTVHAAARTCADGWPGNRKAYISNVWDAVRVSAPQWGLSEIEFKCMLAEAHRSGDVVLANADLKDKKNIRELESSAILYKNTVWHFVRVED
jgi:hypothetical protein